MHIASNAEIDPAKFAPFAAGLCSGATGIRNVAIAPGGIILFIYPAEGNEDLVGQDLIRDRRAQVRADVQRAVRSRRIVLSGPYALRPKGLQLVARQAVYSGETAFWGLVSLDCDISPAFAEAALDPPPAGLDAAPSGPHRPSPHRGKGRPGRKSRHRQGRSPRRRLETGRPARGGLERGRGETPPPVPRNHARHRPPADRAGLPPDQLPGTPEPGRPGADRRSPAVAHEPPRGGGEL